MFPKFLVPIGSAQKIQDPAYLPHDSVINYPSDNYNPCCFLSPDISTIREKSAGIAIESLIQDYSGWIQKGFITRLNYANNTINDNIRNKCDQQRHYTLNIGYTKVIFDIIYNVSEYFILVQLVDTLVNINHAISIYGVWIYAKNDKISSYSKIIIG